MAKGLPDLTSKLRIDTTDLSKAEQAITAFDRNLRSVDGSPLTVTVDTSAVLRADAQVDEFDRSLRAAGDGIPPIQIPVDTSDFEDAGQDLDELDRSLRAVDGSPVAITVDTTGIVNADTHVDELGRSLRTAGDGIGTIQVPIDTSDITDADHELDKLERSLRETGDAVGPLSKRLDSLGFSLGDLGRKATIGLTVPITAGFALATNAASNLNEAVNVTGLTFGDARDEIDEFVKTTAKGLGQSERAAREATASFGGLLQNLEFTNEESIDASITLTKLASDLGSAFNTDPAEAVQALGAALRGETEPIRKYNVILNDAAVRQEAVELGLARTTAEVDANGRAQGALSLIMEQTSKVQGDFANTSEGAANAQRINAALAEDTAASFGEVLLPIYEEVLAGTTKIAGAFDALPGPAKTAVVALAGLAAATGPILTVVDGVGRVTGSLRTASGEMTTFGRIAGGLGKGALVGGAVLALDALHSSLTDISGDLREAATLAGDDLIRAFDAASSKVSAGLTEGFSDLGVFGQRLFGNESGLTEAEQRTRAFEEIVTSNLAQAQRLVDALDERGVDVTAFRAVLERELGVQTQLTKDQATATDLLNVAMGETEGASNAAADGLANVTEAAADSDEKFRGLRDAIDGVGDALYGAVDAQFAYLESEDRIQDALADQIAAQTDYNDTVKTFGINSGEAAYAREQLERADRNLAKAQLDSLKAAEDLETALAEEYLTLVGNEQAAEAFRDKLTDLQAKFPELIGVIQPYIDKLDSIPRDIVTRVSIKQDGTLSFTGSLIEARAEGGPILPGTPYLVGEDGPELIVPSLAGTVVTATQTASLLDGLVDRLQGNGGISFNIDSSDPYEVAVQAVRLLQTDRVLSSLSPSGRSF